MKRIEFIEGEPYCRFDGVMMKPEVYMEVFGFDGELDMLDEDTYLVNGIVYTDKKLGDLIKLFGEVHGEVEEYDEVLTEGRGFASYCAEAQLNNTVVIPLHYIEYLESIKPFNEFANDYPNANIKKYIEFMDCLDEYYKNLFENK